MNSRYRKRNFFEELIEDLPIVEIVVLGVIFIVAISLLFIPKDFLYTLSTLWFISVL